MAPEGRTSGSTHRLSFMFPLIEYLLLSLLPPLFSLSLSLSLQFDSLVSIVTSRAEYITRSNIYGGREKKGDDGDRRRNGEKERVDTDLYIYTVQKTRKMFPPPPSSAV